MMKLYLNYADILSMSVNCSKCNLKKLEEYFEFTNHKIETKYDICLVETYDNVNENLKGETVKPFKNVDFIRNVGLEGKIDLYPKNSEKYLIEKNGKDIVIFSNENKNNYKYILRVIRELIFRKLLEMGFFPVHGSSVVKNGRSNIFVGLTNSGKSTCLLYYTKYDECNPQSNDIVMVGKIQKNWISVSLPEDATFNKVFFTDREEEYKLGSSKVRFTPREFEQYVGKKYEKKSYINSINLVNLNPNHKFSKKINKSKDIDKSVFIDSKVSYDDLFNINNIYPDFNLELMIEENDILSISGNIFKQNSRSKKNENRI